MGRIDEAFGHEDALGSRVDALHRDESAAEGSVVQFPKPMDFLDDTII